MMPLAGLARFGDLSLLGLRLMTGAFLVNGVWDNIVSGERMDEFAVFLARHGFPLAELAAPLSVGVQFVCGVCLLLGLATRAAGLLCSLNFVIALVMVHWNEDFRGWWPALTLVGIGAIFATHGSGRIGIDRFFERSRE
ncbi:DoxX family protein [Sphingopyxis sp.]|jgi:putative oxidoreductase|uniref:DoxX family protein n=1 Tax=Sphingopyxis sp. TaxID=1908224 RepID=UPI003F72E8DD